MRVVVVGAGASAAQVANELAPVADVTVAARHRLRFIPQWIGGHDVHYWLRKTGFDSLRVPSGSARSSPLHSQPSHCFISIRRSCPHE
jgi:cation diffusion facilitator CzcD-associated flavoprotein CzcO